MTSITLNEAYRILEITTTAGSEEIKSAYKRLALKTHPDKNPNDPLAHQRFVKISEAYKQLSHSHPFQHSSSSTSTAHSNSHYSSSGIHTGGIHTGGTSHSSSIDEEESDGENDEPDFDHEDDFAYKMFEKMFFGKNGTKFKGGKVSGGFMFSSRHECDCPHCRCYSKPKTPYIPKSQRPKDPNATPATPKETPAPNADDWLVDLEDSRKSNKKATKTSKKKNSAKKKSKGGTSSNDDTLDSKEYCNTDDIHHGEEQQNSRLSPEDMTEEDDPITEEEMATRYIGQNKRATNQSTEAKKTFLEASIAHPPPPPTNKGKQESNASEKPVVSSKSTVSVNESQSMETKPTPAKIPPPKPSGTQKLDIKVKHDIKETEKKIQPTTTSTSKTKRPLGATQPVSNRSIPMPKPPKEITSTLSKGMLSSEFKYSKQLEALLEMGFMEVKSKSALEKFNGNIELATADLLSSGSSSPIQDFVSSEIEPPQIAQIVEICQIIPPKSETVPENQSQKTELMKQPEQFSDTDVDVDDLLQVPLSYESFTSQLLEVTETTRQIHMQTSQPLQSIRSGVGVVGENRIQASHSLSPQSQFSIPENDPFPSFLSNRSQSEGEFSNFPNYSPYQGLFPNESLFPTMQLFPPAPLFQTDFLSDSRSTSSSISSAASLLSSNELVDEIHFPQPVIPPVISPPASVSAGSGSTIPSPKQVPLSSPATDQKKEPEKEVENISGKDIEKDKEIAESVGKEKERREERTYRERDYERDREKSSNTPICIYYNTPRGCRNSHNCKFLHIADPEKSHESGVHSRPRLINPKRVCAFFPTPAGCKLGNACKFAHQT